MRPRRYSIQREKKHRYFYLWWRDHRNRKQRKSLKTRNAGIAERLKRQRQREYDDSLLAGFDGPCPSVAQFRLEYEKHIRVRKSSGWVRSQSNYLDDIELRWGRLSLREIQAWMVLDLQTEYARRMKNNSTEKRMACIRSLFKLAVQRGYLRANPAATVERLKDDTEVRDEIITPDEYRRLLAFAFLPRLRFYVVLQYHLGARPVELLRLKRTDFDRERRQVRIRGAKDRARKEKIRYLPYPEELELELVNYESLLLPSVEYLFQRNGRAGWSSLDATFRRAARRAGLLASGRQVTPMTLRHTFGVRHAEQGLSMREISYRMGHGSEKTTEKWYARFTPEYAKR